MASRAAASPPLPATASPSVSRLLQIAAAEMGSLTGTENTGGNRQHLGSLTGTENTGEN